MPPLDPDPGGQPPGGVEDPGQHDAQQSEVAASSRPPDDEIVPETQSEEDLETAQANVSEEVNGSEPQGPEPVSSGQEAPPEASGPMPMRIRHAERRRESSTKKPRLKVWLDLAQSLFMRICPKSPVKKTSLSPQAQRLPKLKVAEMERLVDVFEEIVVVQQREWTEWQQVVAGACNTVYRSRQSLAYVLSKHLGKCAIQEAMNNTPVSTKWAEKVTGRPSTPSGCGETYTPFQFDSNVYSEDNIVRLRPQCEQTYGKHQVAAFREGTEDEWTIVQGIVEGTILCRQLPQFINRIMRPEDKARVMGTIRAQVEGCLVMSLDGELPIREAFRNTKCLQERISTAAAVSRNGKNQGRDNRELWAMLAVVKTISYDHVRHEINFHFFTREDAKRFEHMEIPFHKKDHVVSDVHIVPTLQEGQTPWDLQVDADGELVSQASEYSVILRNITRTLDMSRFLAFLQHSLQVPFVFDDLDEGGPNSSTSTAWKLRFTLDGCPQALAGVQRIIWFNTIIVVQHPHMRGGHQCLRCGELGHFLRTCNFSPQALKGTGSMVATEAELARLPTVPQTFTSLEELRQTVEANRLRPPEQQAPQEDEAPAQTPTEEEDNTQAPTGEGQPAQASTEAEEAVQAPTEGAVTGQAPGTNRAARSEPSVNATTPQGTSAEEENGWFDGGSTKNPSRGQIERKDLTGLSSPQTSTPAEHQEPEGSKENPLNMESSDAPSSQDVSPQDSVEGELPRQTAKAKQKEHVNLMVEEDSAKAEVYAVLAAVPDSHVHLERFHGRYDIEEATPMELVEIQSYLGIHPIDTPPTGNCQAYAVVQAMANSSFTGHHAQLAEATAALKRGGMARAQMDFAAKYPPAVRKQTLLRLGRGYEKMGTAASDQAFRQYLKDYGASPSSTDQFIQAQLWGSNDTLASICTLLQRDILVLSHAPGERFWGAVHYEPETRQAKRSNFSFRHAGRGRWNVEAKLPIILHYQSEHYNAYVHEQRVHTPAREEPPGYADAAEDEDMGSSDDDYEDNKDDQGGYKDQDVNGSGGLSMETGASSVNSGPSNGGAMETDDKMEEDDPSEYEGDYGSQSPWNPEEWQGDMQEVRRLKKGSTIHHSLKREIDLILRQGGNRTNELLSFLVSTVSQLSLPKQDKLLSANLKDLEQQKQFMTRYQIPEPVLCQWRQWIEDEREAEAKETAPTTPPPSTASDSEYYPSSSADSPEINTTLVLRQRQMPPRPVKTPLPQKRAHEATPVDRREEAGNVVNANNRAVPLKKRSSDDMSKDLRAEFDAVALPSSQPARQSKGCLPSWPLHWNAQATVWQERAKSPFPEVGAAAEVWKQAATSATETLLSLLRTFSYPHEIIQRMPASAIDA